MAGLSDCFAYCCIALVLLSSQSVSGDEHEAYFENHIRPLFAEHCVKCHGPEEQSGGLRLDAADDLFAGGESGRAITPHDPAASLLIQAIRYDGDIKMPPDAPLDAPQVQHLENWVRAGAPWPRTAGLIRSTAVDASRTHWAFQPVRNPDVPDLNGQGGAADSFRRNEIDAFISQRLEQVGLSHSPEADRRTLIRRLHYTLTGLPPGNDDVARFLDNTNPQAYEHLIDQLLSSPAYGEHWARHWLDVARYSDTKGYVYAREERFWIHAWAYRDWVVRSLNQDMPYDRFLLLQMAADQVADREPDDLAAMGFLTLGRRFLGVQRDIIDDRIDVVTRGTMSLTVGCARCHDHKYDPIPTADYYSLYGVFASGRERMVPLPGRMPDEAFDSELQNRRDKLNNTLQERRVATAERLRMRIGDYLAAQFQLEKYPEEGFDQVIATSDLLPAFVRRWQEYLRRAKREHDPVFVVWHDWLEWSETRSAAGEDNYSVPASTNPRVAAIFEDPPLSRAEMIQRYASLFTEIDKEWTAAITRASNDGLSTPVALEDSAAEQCRQVLYGIGSPCVVPDEPVVHTEYDFDSGTCNELWKLQGEVDRWIINSATPQPFAVVIEDRQTLATPRIFKRGNPAQKGDEVPRQFLKLLSGPDRQPFQTGSGRLEMARAIIDSNNPLTARVMVNRVWAHHFGTGLVATPGDFGTRAEPPSHPELLDWLTNWFVDHGWSLKQLHRLILTSGTFRQSSFGPQNQQAIRSALEHDPGNRLLWRMNVHRLSFEEMRDSILASTGQLNLGVGGKPVELLKPPFADRRTLYGLVDRQFLPGTLRMFDFANPDLHIPQRSDTTVPQQALFLMNHPMVVDRIARLVDDVSGEGDQEAVVRALYSHILQRAPSTAQLHDAMQYLNASAQPASQPLPSTIRDWSYGYGKYDEPAGCVSDFKLLPHFNGAAWQGGEAWPDAELGWVQLTATGGHPGNDRSHASIRRWTAPKAMTIHMESEVIHSAAPGDGIRVFVISSRDGLLAGTKLHQQTISLNVDAVNVAAGDTIDFVCDIGDVLNSDQHEWRINLASDKASSEPIAWNSESDFTGTTIRQQSPLEQLAQVLLCSNEFYFID